MSTYITAKSVSPVKGDTVPQNEAITFSWSVEPSSVNPEYVPEQASAIFRWSTTNEEPWYETQITGSDQNVTIAADTFPGTGVIYWRVTVTDVSGTTSLTSSFFYPRLFAELAMTAGAGVNNQYPDQTFSWSQGLTEQLLRIGITISLRSMFMFDAPPAAWAYKAILCTGIYCKAFFPTDAGRMEGLLYPLAGTFDPHFVTWNTMPGMGEPAEGFVVDPETDQPGTMFQFPKVYPSNSGLSRGAALIAAAPAVLMKGPTFYNSAREYIMPQPPVSLRLWFLDQTVTSKPQAAKYASGYVNRHAAQIFSWDLVPDGDYYCFGDWTQTLANFYYRAGTSGNWTLKQITGAEQFVELAENTLAAGTVQWKVQTTDDQGTTAESEIYTIDTTDSETSATPITPYNTIENGDAEIVFEWETSNDHGTAPTGADLQYSTDGSSWSTLGSLSGAATDYSAAAETFLNGTVYWRVRAYNADSVAGSWSDPVSFVCMAAPPQPVVSATEVPYATISWQSDGQQTYRVTVDGKSYGPYFGTKKSFDLPDYLSDGQHTATVEVQGSSGLWSHPGSVTFNVTNVPGAAVTLTGLFDRDAELSWATNDATSDFLVYRDGVQIGHASGRSFTDRVVLGYHSWRVINRLPGGYYTASNVVSGTLMTGRLAIAPLSGGAWLELAKSENSARSVVWNESQRVVLRQFAGQIYPQAEAAPYKTMSAGFDVAWTHAEAEQAAVFASLIGQPVIFKTPCEGAMVGILTAWQRNNMHFYRSYSATVQRIHWRDYVDADD